MKTKFDSYTLNGISKGCKYCVLGKKLVLFLGGKCSRNCWYCSLSSYRKKCFQIFANERPINRVEDLFKEIEESKAEGAGITGGDPLVNFSDNVKILKAIRKKIGKKFHIHIYLPLTLVNKKKIFVLKKYIDEIRLHPSFLFNHSRKIRNEEVNKIKMISKIFKRKNTGIELPLIPKKEKEIYQFVLDLEKFIGFVNLNEFEISETNFKKVTKNFSLNEDSYTIFGSLIIGKNIIRRAKKDKLDIKIHICSAKTKDFHQYKNRSSRHKILPFGKRLKNGNVVYFAVYEYPLKNLEKIIKITKNCFYDEMRKRILIKMEDVLKVYEKLNVKIAKIEEQPFFGNERVSFSLIGEE